MSKSNVFCAVVALLVCGMQADAAQPSAAKMSQMGLSGAQVVSDSVAMDVRGFGYRGGARTNIWGYSEVEVKVRFRGVSVKVESAHGYDSTTNGQSQIGGDLSFVGAAVIGGGNNNDVALTTNGGGHGVPILFAGGVSGVYVSGGHRAR